MTGTRFLIALGAAAAVSGGCAHRQAYAPQAAVAPEQAAPSYGIPAQDPKGTVYALSLGGEYLPTQQGASLYLHLRLAAENTADDAEWVLDANEQTLSLGQGPPAPAAFALASNGGPVISVREGAAGDARRLLPAAARGRRPGGDVQLARAPRDRERRADHRLRAGAPAGRRRLQLRLPLRRLRLLPARLLPGRPVRARVRLVVGRRRLLRRLLRLGRLLGTALLRRRVPPLLRRRVSPVAWLGPAQHGRLARARRSRRAGAGAAAAAAARAAGAAAAADRRGSGRARPR